MCLPLFMQVNPGKHSKTKNHIYSFMSGRMTRPGCVCLSGFLYAIFATKILLQRRHIFMSKEDLTQIQIKLDYQFKNVDLLDQAFTRKSYSEENGGSNNEVLEFFGDKALDLIVVKYLSD
jgi:hypothetical protein